jgi:hypothetical protein
VTVGDEDAARHHSEVEYMRPDVGTLDHVAVDQSLLAFIKCHVTTLSRWGILCVLVSSSNHWSEPQEIAQLVRQPANVVATTLLDLALEGVLCTQWGPEGSVYRLAAAEPSGRVASRLVAEVPKSLALRRFILAQVLSPNDKGDDRLAGKSESHN